jgi:cell division septation protein DedD
MSLAKTPRNPIGGGNAPLQRDPAPERSQGPKTGKSGKRYRFECSRLQLGMFGCGAVVALIWMFVFGVMVGRDLPLADSEDQSLRGRWVRFMGLPQRETKPATAPGSKTEDPNRHLEELDYHKALTQKSDAAANPSPAQTETPSHKKSVSLPSSADSTGRPSQKATPKGNRPSDKKEDAASAPMSSGNESHGLLVASLRSQENAQKLVQRLRAKGYDPQMEALDKPDSGRWYRIIVGSFHSREDAQRFAAEFNKRENAQGMVIRLTP